MADFLVDVKEGKDYSFPKEEEAIQEFWKEVDAFKVQLEKTKGMPEYSFYDGPPFATGLPHYGHILAGTIKDVVTRYASATGHYVERRFGWDCHGLPVEYEIDQMLGIKSKDDVLKLGIGNYNEECRKIVMRYSKEWEVVVNRMGRWIDFENDYKTLDPSFMESVWWVFKELWDKDLVYRGFKVMPYSTTCNTPLSNFEAGLNYKDVSDPAVMVTFPLHDDPDNASMIAWTTTPWTLPSNLALCVHPDFNYCKMKDPATGKVYIVAESRVATVPGMAATKGKKGKEGTPGFEKLATMKGSELKGKTYTPLFGYYSDLKDRAFKVCNDTYVTDDSGTGVVHQAPAFGEDDYRVCIAHGVIEKGGDLPNPIDANGCFLPIVTDFVGEYVKDADKNIMARLKTDGRMFNAGSIVHKYPFCWRSDTPLIYKAVPSWFVKVETLKEKLVANNMKTYWVPQFVKDKRFHNWLENAHDWAISRTRYWGTPLPVWCSDDLKEVVVVGSVEQLYELSGVRVTDLHRHFLDDITIPSKTGGPPLKRVEDVFDCWFESGSMPYAQKHYPFENKEQFERTFPADFIAEGLDQTRGWFYTLMVLSTALFDKPAFQNLVCNGLVLASDGKKMSKRLKNYPDPMSVVDKYGADALRLYLINSPVVRADPLRFKEEGVFGVVKDVFLPWYNAYRFLVQNAIRYAQEEGENPPLATVDLSKADNVLDRWILEANKTLTKAVETEMEAYRLYNVVPALLEFIEALTNIYVRYNRKRLKGKNGKEDTLMALGTLYHVLMTLCKAMAPATPFFAETMYQNLRRCEPGSEGSVHWCMYPKAPAGEVVDERLQESVRRMQIVIDLGRNIREKRNKALKMPLKKMVVVHDSQEFLSDISGLLSEYVTDELNIQTLETCSDPMKYCSVKAEPNWKELGQKLGKGMGPVAAGIKKMSTEDILKVDKGGEVTVAGQVITSGEMKVVKEFKLPEGLTEEQVEATSNGDVLVLLYLEADESLQGQGIAREVCNKVQKMRKSAGLVVGAPVEVYVTPTGDASSVAQLESVLTSQDAYFKESLGSGVMKGSLRPKYAVPIEQQDDSALNGTIPFTVILTLPTVCANVANLKALVKDDATVEGVTVWLASRSVQNLKAEAEKSGNVVSATINGKALKLEAGKHFHYSVGASQ